MKKLNRALVSLGLLLLTPLVASAALTTYGFNQITSNGNAPVGNQLSVGVYDSAQANFDFGLSLGANEVLFKFNNAGPTASSITDVYFDDGSLLGISAIYDGLSSGVAFSPGASPPDLPGGGPVNFNTTAGFLADSDSPTATNGVNPLETLGIAFTLIGGQTYADTIAALTLGLANPGVDVTGGLRIGLHVQAIGGLGSESFVNGPPDFPPPPPPPPAVPEPGTMLMWGLGLAATCVTRRFMKA